MKIVLTYGEINESGYWEDFCDARGMNYWCMNEGLSGSEDEAVFTPEELIKLGMIDLVIRKLERIRG